MSTSPPAPKRSHSPSQVLIDGRAADGPVTRARALRQRILVTASEREEAEIERQIRALPGVTRPNLVAVLSPTGGVGKTTGAFVVATLLAVHLKLRVIAVDAAGAFGTLGRLTSKTQSCERSIADLLHNADRLHTAAQLRRYVFALPSGLHLLASSRDTEIASRLAADDYGELITFLSCFYEVVLLDLGPGLVAPLPRLAITRADQLLLATTPEWVNAQITRAALGELPPTRTTAMVNRSRLRPEDARALERRLRTERSHRAVTIPQDEQLAAMLDTGTYSLDALRRTSRMAIKRLGLTIAERLA